MQRKRYNIIVVVVSILTTTMVFVNINASCLVVAKLLSFMLGK